MTQRTDQQRKAIEVGCKLIADSLTAAGLDMRKTLKPEIDIPWSQETVKDYIFRPVMKALYKKESTTQLEKQQEIDLIWETIMRFLMQNHHIDYIPFPHNEEKDDETLGGYKTQAGVGTVGYNDDYKEPTI